VDGPCPSSLCPNSSSLLLLYLSPTSLFLGVSFLVVVVSPSLLVVVSPFLLGVSSSSSCRSILRCCCTPSPSSSCHFPSLSWVRRPARVADGLYSLGLGGWGVLSWRCRIPRTDVGPASLSSNLSPWSNLSPSLNPSPLSHPSPLLNPSLL